MKKRLLSFGIMMVFVLTLAGCWAGEIMVDTVFNADGSGERTFVLTVMDDSLVDEGDIITNPEDPDGTKDYGPVYNDKHIVGGIPAIQTWLEENAPAYITVHPMQTEGYNRIFTLSFTFADFDEFLTTMENLVNLSPVLDWTDFDADELPTFTCGEGVCTFKESRIIVEAAMDWAIDGIFNDIYDADDLEGWVGKGDIAAFASYRVVVIDETYEELRHYDPDADDGVDPVTDEPRFGKIIWVQSDEFEVTGNVPEVDEPSSSCFSSTFAIPILVVAFLGLGVALGTAHVFKRR